MYRTKQFLSGSVSAVYLKLSLEELALMYQEQQNIEVFSTAFYKVYNLAYQVKENYWGLNDDDVASWCLEKLDYCLKTYNGENKFSTYFYKVFSNKLREETESLNAKKRKCILVSINELLNVGLEDTYNLLECILPDTLTQREKEVCLMKSQGYENKDCAEKLHVSKMTICNIEKSLKNKLITLQNQ